MIKKILIVMAYRAFTLVLATTSFCSENDPVQPPSRPILPSSDFEILPFETLKLIAMHARIKDGIVLTEVSRTFNKALQNDPEVLENYARRIPGNEFHSFPLKKQEEDSAIYSQRTSAFLKGLINHLRYPTCEPLMYFNPTKPVAVSGDGKTMVGTFSFPIPTPQGESEIGDIIGVLSPSGLHKFAPENYQAQGLGVDYSGSFIIGTMHPNGQVTKALFRNMETGTLTRLKDLETNSEPRAISTWQGKTIIAGIAYPNGPNPSPRAVQWTLEQGSNLQTLALVGTSSNQINSEANGISLDGTTMVGTSQDATDGNKLKAFVMSNQKGFCLLGTLKDDVESEAKGISAHGDIVVGNSYKFGTEGEFDEPNSRAFRWLKVLENLLNEYKTDPNITIAAGGIMSSLGMLPGYTDSYATAISANGRIIGFCADKQNKFQAFIWDQTIGGMQSIDSLIKEFLTEDITFVTADSINANGTIILLKGTFTTPEGPSIRIFRIYFPRFDVLEAQGINVLKVTPVLSDQIK